jgi:crotonobetainyl-CoA:carnitine CoA-transferase CaiB-like acyl-CoA transferase
MSWAESGDGTDGPLTGIRILDFSNWLPGPFCTQLLGDLGADVVKVEAPAGDPGRGGAGWVFSVANRNKRSIVADLKDSNDRAACLNLAMAADVVVEGFRPGIADKLGIGYQAVRAVNAAVIYCSISGYGQTGPSRLQPGHDLSYLAVSGALTFAPHWKRLAPRRSGVPIADLSGAFYAAVAILAALRDRDRTGNGSYLDVGIADAALAVASLRAGSSFRVAEQDRTGVYPSNDIYAASDGELLAISAVEQHFWERLREALTPYAPALAESRFDTGEGRHENGDELCGLIALAFGQRTADQWLDQFKSLDVPVDKIVSVAQAARSPHTLARGIVAHCGTESQVVFPVIRDGEVLGKFRSLPPSLGDSTAQILKR